MKVFIVTKKAIENTIPRQFEDIKTGPFPVLQISAWQHEGDYGHYFLVQDGLKFRSIDESKVEIATPLDEALT